MVPFDFDELEYYTPECDWPSCTRRVETSGPKTRAMCPVHDSGDGFSGGEA